MLPMGWRWRHDEALRSGLEGRHPSVFDPVEEGNMAPAPIPDENFRAVPRRTKDGIPAVLGNLRPSLLDERRFRLGVDEARHVVKTLGRSHLVFGHAAPPKLRVGWTLELEPPATL